MFQLNERLTWLRGRHTLKFGGSWNYYRSESFYPGNNGQQRVHLLHRRSTSRARRLPTSCSIRCRRKGKGSTSDAWTHLQHRVGVYAADDFKISTNLTLNLGLRWAYTSPFVEKDDRQANFDLTNAQRSSWPGRDGNSRALYDPYYNGWEPRLGLAYRLGRALGVPRRLRHHAVHGRHGRQPAAAAQPAVLLRIAGAVRRDQRARHDRHRLRGSAGARPAVRAAARVGPGHPAAAHAPVERVRRVPARLAVVDQRRLRRQRLDEHHHDDRRQPAAAGHRRSAHLAAGAAAPAALPVQPGHHLPHHDDVAQGVANYNALQTTFKQRLWHGLDFSANYTLEQGDDEQPRLLRLGRRRRRAPRRRRRSTAATSRTTTGRRTSTPRTSSRSPAATSCRSAGSGSSAATGTARSTRVAGGWSLSFAVTAHTRLSRSPWSTARRRRCRRRAPPSGPTGSAAARWTNPTLERWIDRAAFVSAPLGQFGNSGIGILRAPGYWNVDLSRRQAVRDLRAAVPDVPRRDVQRAEPSELRTAERQHPEHGVRHDHQHGQRCAHRAAGREVLSSDQAGAERAAAPLDHAAGHEPSSARWSAARRCVHGAREPGSRGHEHGSSRVSRRDGGGARARRAAAAADSQTTASSPSTSRRRSPACRARIPAAWSPCIRRGASTRRPRRSTCRRCRR